MILLPNARQVEYMYLAIQPHRCFVWEELSSLFASILTPYLKPTTSHKDDSTHWCHYQAAHLITRLSRAPGCHKQRTRSASVLRHWPDNDANTSSGEFAGQPCHALRILARAMARSKSNAYNIILEYLSRLRLRRWHSHPRDAQELQPEKNVL